MLKNRKGFTLIELLIVVVIIGILAAIALPKFSSARERAYYSAMKSDLKSVASAQEIFYSKALRYTDNKDSLNIQQSQGVQLGTIQMDGTGGTDQGWYLQAEHQSLPASTGCAIYNGEVPTNTVKTPAGKAVEKAGVPTCDE